MSASTDGTVRTVRLPSGHKPMLSMPGNLVAIFRGEVGRLGD